MGNFKFKPNMIKLFHCTGCADFNDYLTKANINPDSEGYIELSKLLKGMNCYVNLIPYNETENIEFKRSKNDQIMKFYDILKKNRISVTIRKEFGSKVDAACGQLRANQEL